MFKTLNTKARLCIASYVSQSGEPCREYPKDYTIIEVPVQKVVCMTTLQLSNFIKLNAIDKVVGMTSTHYLFNQQMKDRIKNG